MSINIQLYEATGPGKVSELVYNMNWKNISAPDSSYKYWVFPVRRPITGVDPEPYNCSYTKYVYAKISGTYSKAKRVRWTIQGGSAANTIVYYEMTNTYTNPSTSLLSSGTYILQPGGVASLYPNLSTVGPDSATARVNTLLPNTTYYTDYLVTQLYVPAGSHNQIGNVQGLTFMLSLDDYE